MPQRLAQHLISKRLLPASTVDEGLKRMQRQGGALDTVLLEMQTISEAGMLQAISDVSGVRLVNLADFEPNAEAAPLMPEKMSKQLGCVPLSLDGNALHLACTYPIPQANLKDVGFLLGRTLELWVALECRIRDWQHVLYGATLEPRYRTLLHLLDPHRPRPADPTITGGDSVSEDVKALAKRGVVQEPILLTSPKAKTGTAPATKKVVFEVVPLGDDDPKTNVVDVTAYGRFAKTSSAPDMSAAFEESDSTRVLDVSGYANLAKELSKEQALVSADTTTAGMSVAGLFPGGVLPPRASAPEQKRQLAVPAIAPAPILPAVELPPPRAPATGKLPAFTMDKPGGDNVIVSPQVFETTQSITMSPEMAAALHREQLTAQAARTQDEDLKYSELEKKHDAVTRPQQAVSAAAPKGHGEGGYPGAMTPSPSQSASGMAFINARDQEAEAERTASFLSMRPKLPPPPEDPEKTSAFLSMRPKGTSIPPLPSVPPPAPAALKDETDFSDVANSGPHPIPADVVLKTDKSPAHQPAQPVITDEQRKRPTNTSLQPVTSEPKRPSQVNLQPVGTAAEQPSQTNLKPVAEDDFSDINTPPPPVPAGPPPLPQSKQPSQASLKPVAESDFSDINSPPPQPVPVQAVFTPADVDFSDIAIDDPSIPESAALPTPPETMNREYAGDAPAPIAPEAPAAADEGENVLIAGETPAPEVPPEPEQVVPQPSPRRIYSHPGTEKQPTILAAPPGLAPSTAMDWTLAQARASLNAASTDRDQLVSIILEYGRRTFDFVATFAVMRGAAYGWDMRGDGEFEMLRSLAIPLDTGGMFRTVAMTRGSYVGPPPNDTYTQHYLASMGRAPRTAFVWPIEVQSRLVAFIYGDCGSKPVSQRRLTDFILFCQELPAAFHDLILVRKNAIAEAQSGHHTPVPALVDGFTGAAEETLDASWFSGLLKLLTGPDANERNLAMVELMKSPSLAAERLGFAFPGPTAWSRLPVEQLPEADELGPIPGALARLGQPGAAALAPLLLSPDADTRYLALLTAGSLQFPDVVDGVVKGLFDEEPDISSAARAAATTLKYQPKFVDALKAIRGELRAEDGLRRSLAARALGVVHDRNSIEALIAHVDDLDPLASGAAMDALKEITRFDAGADQKEWLSWLESARSKRRIEWVVAALDAPDFDTRLSAIEELSRTFGDTWGYSPDAPEAEREAAAEAWRQFIGSRPDLDV